MAKIVIEIEDLDGGRVRVDIKPNFSTLMQLTVTGRELTAAQGYAICAANAIRYASKAGAQVKIPKLRGGFYR